MSLPVRPYTRPLPVFVNGVLPAGIHAQAVDQLRNSFLVTGEGVASRVWDRKHRLWLVDRLASLVPMLDQVPGVRRLVLDGSFVEDKDHPNDIDCYLELDPTDLISIVKTLNILDPLHKPWGWSESSLRRDPESGKLKFPLWHSHRVDIYPHYAGFGLTDEFGNELIFESAFQRTRDGRRKGVVEIVDIA